MADPKSLTQNRLLVEVAWEVCWQIGGIYTVLRSKAPVMVQEWGSRYCMVGPYNPASASVEFEPLPRTGYFGRACEILEEKGIYAHYGRWLITGKPYVVLIDFVKSFSRVNEYKYFLWKDHHISAGDDREVNDVVLFGYLVAEFFEALVDAVEEFNTNTDTNISMPILAQFHEWMAGVPIPVINQRKLPIASVFTTHATLLGRYLAVQGGDFYDRIPFIDPHRAAGDMNIYARYAIERAATHGATCFTTISGITAKEAEHFLGRKADVILPNGLNIHRFAAPHTFQNMHVQFKDKIHEFVMAHFFPCYTFDLDQTLYVFSSGRYEQRNKGFDLFIEGLARLNYRLKAEKSKRTVIAFIITRASSRGINVNVLKNQMLFKSLSSACTSIAQGMGPKLLNMTAAGKAPVMEQLLSEYDQLRLKRLMHAWKQTGPLPSIVTHDLANDATDPILAQLRTCQLFNRPEDPVKVIYHPDFLSSTSPIIGLDYDQFVRGCHLGVFPSYYEPWGYTPQECCALGVPSISSDLAGFGSFLSEHIPDHNENGLYLVRRAHRSFHDSADELMGLIRRVVTMTVRERIELRNRVESQSVKFDWKEMYSMYQRAQEIALIRATEPGLQIIRV